MEVLYRKCFLSVVVFITTLISTLSQTIEIKNVELHEKQIHVRYNLNDSIVERYYTIRLYSSHDDFLNPLVKVSGDVGMEVAPGSDRVVIWDAEKELGTSYEGKIALEIRARVFVPFINTDDFQDIKTLTRLRKESLTWSGGRPSNILNFGLYRGEEKVTTFSNIANVGHHNVELPSHIKPGKGYYFVISDIKNKDEVVKTNQFKVRRRIPLALKIVPATLLTSVVIILTSADDPSQDLPDPIVPSKNLIP